jgi:hypothetical protein
MEWVNFCRLKIKLKAYLYLILPDFQIFYLLLEGLLVSPACPSKSGAEIEDGNGALGGMNLTKEN